MDSQWLDWESAWQQALYGPEGFVHTSGPPAQHFRTSVHVGTVLAEALLELLERTDHALERPAGLDLVDLGAGGGELLASMVELAAAPLRRRLRPIAVDLRPNPPGWSWAWSALLPESVHGLVIAHEWLDALPCPVVQHDGAAYDGPAYDGPACDATAQDRTAVRRVQVTRDGRERLGPVIGADDAAWLRRWWPLAPGDRAELGEPRERAWRRVLEHVDAGAALAVDYGHTRGMRPSAGTLSAYRTGRQVRPTPDGSCDLTAHVALDAIAATAPGTHTTQAAALHALGASAPESGSWLDRTVRAGQVAELTDPAGLGRFGWVLHPVGLPRQFASQPARTGRG